jgi:hypothetical protein
MFGGMLLAAWLDFLTPADVVLRQCPHYSAERLFMDLGRVQRRLEPTLAALASLVDSWGWELAHGSHMAWRMEPDDHEGAPRCGG